jgi:hypothetical protein
MHFTRLVFAFALLAAPALAQSNSGGMAHSDTMGHMSSMSSMHHNASMHTMPATVTSVDDKTGLVEVNSAGMALKLHFPPSSLNGLKTGDKITLHLGFTKP